MKYCITKEPDNNGWSLFKISDDDKYYYYCKDGTFSWSRYNGCPKTAKWKSLDSLINSFTKQYNSGDFDILLSI